ncbi:MAG: PEGA domain-containing protein [Archangium sp.]|nr:PEGA domain-containing protein [Archangium sp.]
MDLQKPVTSRGLLAKPVVLLTLAAIVLAAAPARAEKTLWLVRPLYPGQETLIERTEKALDKLMPGDARKDAVIGHKELVSALKGHGGGELPCFGVEARCADPIDPFVANLGFDRIVLIQGGQDEAGFKYRVVSYEPRAGKVNPATATNANLEKALLGALAKVVPAASTLEVKSTPSGATVFVDDVKVGVTPLTTQVLPGERVVRFDLKLHQPLEESIIIPIRGNASIEKTLEKVAARIVITASPPGTEISIDGAVIGKDKVDRGIAPGDHTIRLTAENHKAFEQTVSVKADQQYSLDKTLEPVPGLNVVTKPPDPNDPNGKVAVVIRHDPNDPNDPANKKPPEPPKPATPEDLIYERRSYFHATFEIAQLMGANMVARRLDSNAYGRTTQFFKNGVGQMPTLIGGGLEYGTFGKYFGMTVFGVGYLTTLDNYQMAVGYEPGQRREQFAMGAEGPQSIQNVKVNLGVVRILHPQFRIALWKFQLGLQVGLEVRIGHIIGPDGTDAAVTSYKDGFMITDLLLTGKLNVRFYIVDGLFLHLQGNYAQILIGWQATDEGGKTYTSASSLGATLGVGYAF